MHFAVEFVDKLLPELAGDCVVAAYRFRHAHGRLPRLLSPQSFTEKVTYRMLFDRRSLLAQFADKYAVRDYVAARLGEEVLPRLHHVTTDPADLPFDALPPRFVVKPTHGSNWVRAVTDAPRLDRAELVATCRAWLAQSYDRVWRERIYRTVVPRIIVEEYIDDGTGDLPIDYKFFVFDGRVALVQVVSERSTGKKQTLYDPHWRRLPVTKRGLPAADDDLPRPAHLAEMMRVAEILGEGVDFVRVDLYDACGRVLFGEMTATPSAGLDGFDPPSFDAELGRLWTMPRRLRD